MYCADPPASMRLWKSIGLGMPLVLVMPEKSAGVEHTCVFSEAWDGHWVHGMSSALSMCLHMPTCASKVKGVGKK